MICHNERPRYAFLMTFGARLKQARVDMEMSGAALGKRLTSDVTRQTVSHWEKNRTKPDVDQLIELCAVLKVSADYLLLGEMKKLSPEARKIAGWFDDLSKVDRDKWFALLEVTLRPPIDQERVSEATPERPRTDFTPINR